VTVCIKSIHPGKKHSVTKPFLALYQMAPALLLWVCHMACWVIVRHEVHTSAGSAKVHIEGRVTTLLRPKMTNGFTDMHTTTDTKPEMFAF